MSILKKRDDREGKTIAQVQQRQTKRRVRFQEMEDTLDQGNLKLLIQGLHSWMQMILIFLFTRVKQEFIVHTVLAF